MIASMRGKVGDERLVVYGGLCVRGERDVLCVCGGGYRRRDV